MLTKRPFQFTVLCLLLLTFFLSLSPSLSAAQTHVGSIKGKVQVVGDNPAEEDKGDEEKGYDPFTTQEFPYQHPSLVTQAIALAAMSLMPFFIMLLTSFAKISIVLSLLRSALGTQQAPPNQVINGVALLMTLFIMFPTGLQMYEAAQPVIQNKAPTSITSPEAAEYVVNVINAAKEPFRGFLQRNSSVMHIKRFYDVAYSIAPEEFKQYIKQDDFIVLTPAFITSQLKGAFEIGVLIYIPFFIIDMVTSNILLAMGMMMLSPMTISLPLKIFLLVMMDGWTLLITGLVQTFH